MSSAGCRPLTEAIIYRVFKAIPREIEERSFAGANRLYTNELLLGRFLYQEEPMDVWKWLLSMRVNRRRKMLVKAYNEMLARGEPHQDFEFIQAFVKSEHLPLFGVGGAGPDIELCKYIPRLIQAPHDETHIIAGPYLKPLTTRLKDVWNSDNWIFYASVKPEKLDAWLKRNAAATTWYMSDYSAFDATWSAQAWALIESIYRRVYPNADDEFWRVLDIWRSPRGKIRCRKEDVRISYEANICNASGRDDTALANALLNGLVLSLSFSAALAGKQIDDLTPEDVLNASEIVQIAIVGDDSLVACSMDVNQYVVQIEKNIASFGLMVKSQTTYSLVDVTFLGMMPYMVGGSFYWGPTIGRRVYKAFWQVDPCGNLGAWTRGVAQQLELYANVPVLYDLAHRINQLLVGQKVTKVQEDENRVWATIDTARPHWDAATLDWVVARYAGAGLTVEQVREDLRTISRIDRLPAVVHLWTAEAAVCTDDL